MRERLEKMYSFIQSNMAESKTLVEALV